MASLRDAEVWGRRPGVSSRFALLDPRLMDGNPLGCWEMNLNACKAEANMTLVGKVS